MFDTHDLRTADLALAAYLAAVIRTELGADPDCLDPLPYDIAHGYAEQMVAEARHVLLANMAHILAELEKDRAALDAHADGHIPF
jgi:hypothetical protein